MYPRYKYEVGKMKKLSMERLRPIRDEVYHIVRNDIIRGVYKPGDRLQEEQLAEQLGTSRTPVREALRKLEVERFVSYTPHRGTVVTAVSIDEVEELYQVRMMLEAFIAKRAAINSTHDDIRKLRKALSNCEKCTEPDDILDSVEEFNRVFFETAKCDSLVDINRRVREILQRVLVSNHPSGCRSGIR
jgi:DNA-binding GntR family transcriptional regulator